MMAARFWLAPVVVVIIRWFADMNVIFIASYVLSTMIFDEQTESKKKTEECLHRKKRQV